MNKNIYVVLISMGLCLGFLILKKNQEIKDSNSMQPPWLNQNWTPEEGQNKPSPEINIPKKENPEQILAPSSYKEAIALGQRLNKNILLIFNSDNCPWCVKMHKETLSKSSVKDKMSKYVTYIANVNSEADVRLKYSINGVPAYAIVSPNESILAEGAGFKTEKEFGKWLDQVK